MRLSIVVPAHNEEDNIEEVIERIEKEIPLEHELVVVDDHSSDKTRELVRKAGAKFPNLKLVENDRDAGFANALRSGFENARGEAIVPVMGDLCDELSSVSLMLEKIDQGYDVVCGSRYMAGGVRSGGSRLKAFLSSWGGRTLYYLVGIPTHDIANAFKMYRKKVIDSIDIESKGFEISMELPLKAYILGFKITEVATVWKERVRGKSSFRIFKLLPAYLKLYLWAIYKRIRGKICLCSR